MALHNPSNWHYVDTNVQPETEQYFKDEFEGLHAEEGGVTAKVSEVQKLPKQDDVYIHVSQKRGKLWALFMFTLEINFTGNNPQFDLPTRPGSLPRVSGFRLKEASRMCWTGMPRDGKFVA
jgi:activator of HSP90 ATPase